MSSDRSRHVSFTKTIVIATLVALSAVALLLVSGAGGPARTLGAYVQDLVPGSALDANDGLVGDERLSINDTVQPAIARLDPDLEDALREATGDAAADGITLGVTSGWRSREFQQDLFDDAIDTYGSPAAAERWVASPDTSKHVTGEAVDIGPTDAAYWMSEHGAHYGLCQVYSNEIWHYELFTIADGICPDPLKNASS